MSNSQKFIALVLSIIALVIVLNHSSYRKRVYRAEIAYSDAVNLENRGQVQAAYHRYVSLCEFSFRIEREDLPPGVCQRQQRLHDNIRSAYDETIGALDAYRTKHGRYPATLNEISADIPQQYVLALQGFGYSIVNNSEFLLTTGLDGSASFSLR